jgi:hypothetical protein
MHKLIIYNLILILTLFFQISAGTSIFGLAPGSLGTVNMNSSTSAIGRGGFEIAYFDTLSLNNANYAQWPLLTQTTINLNMAYKRMSTETSSQSTVSYSGNFSGGHLAIPVINKKLVFGVALLPAISSDQAISIENAGLSTNVVETLKSTGNISEGSLITSYVINDHISIAGIVSYNFGLMEDKITLDYDAQGYLDIVMYNKYKIYGSSFALHSFFKLDENLYSGLTLKLPSKLTLKTEQNSVNSNEYVIESRKIDIPLRASYGMAYLFKNQYILGVDVDYQSWKNGYKIDGIKQKSFANNYRVSLGLEKMPSGRRFVPYSEKMYYRGGIYFGQINMLSNGNNVIEFGIGLGVGLPILSPNDRIDLAIQYGRRGDLTKNLALENIFKFNVSVTAGSLWFVREDN